MRKFFTCLSLIVFAVPALAAGVRTASSAAIVSPTAAASTSPVRPTTCCAGENSMAPPARCIRIPTAHLDRHARLDRASRRRHRHVRPVATAMRSCSPDRKARGCTSTRAMSRFVSHGTKLAGRIVMPPGEGKVPLVVLIHGSEPDSALASYSLQRMLPAQGIAAFVYDKRGTGSSGGKYTQDYSLLADDAVAAVATARAAGGRAARPHRIPGRQPGRLDRSARRVAHEGRFRHRVFRTRRECARRRSASRRNPASRKRLFARRHPRCAESRARGGKCVRQQLHVRFRRTRPPAQAVRQRAVVQGSERRLRLYHPAEIRSGTARDGAAVRLAHSVPLRPDAGAARRRARRSYGSSAAKTTKRRAAKRASGSIR